MTRIIQGRRGFTLMELLTVMVIMSIILATGLVSYVGARRGAELRGAASTVQSVISLARQHAVTKRRTTAIVFRKEGSGTTFTNCYYVFEQNGKAQDNNPRLISQPSPLPPENGFWPSNGTYICNLSSSAGRIGRLNDLGKYDGTTVTWQKNEEGDWVNGDAYGFQVNEKQFIPPGVTCTVDGGDNKRILFYANGKASGVDKVDIKLTDKMSAGSVFRTVTVYPLVGLVENKLN